MQPTIDAVYLEYQDVATKSLETSKWLSDAENYENVWYSQWMPYQPKRAHVKICNHHISTRFHTGQHAWELSNWHARNTLVIYSFLTNRSMICGCSKAALMTYPVNNPKFGWKK